jgi:hypothetical protein
MKNEIDKTVERIGQLPNICKCFSWAWRNEDLGKGLPHHPDCDGTGSRKELSVIDRLINRVGLLLDGKTICFIHFAEVEMRSDGYTATCSKLCDVEELKSLANAYTQLKADLATAKQGLEHIAGNWECGHQGECRCLSDIAQDTLDKIGKE